MGSVPNGRRGSDSTVVGAQLRRADEVPITAKTQKTSGKWYIRTDIDYSVEALRFLNETVVYDRERRPFPDRLADHPYFKCDLSHQVTVRERLSELARQELTCLNQPQGVPSPPSGSGRKLWFDAKDPSSFEELYQYCTGRANSRIGAPDDVERDARPDSETARSGARSFLSTVNPLRKDSPGSLHRGTLCQHRVGGLRDTTINVDVLLFGDHHAGKKAFMTAFRADDGEPEDRTVSRNKNFEFIDYAKRTVQMRDADSSYAAMRLWRQTSQARPFTTRLFR